MRTKLLCHQPPEVFGKKRCQPLTEFHVTFAKQIFNPKARHTVPRSHHRHISFQTNSRVVTQLKEFLIINWINCKLFLLNNLAIISTLICIWGRCFKAKKCTWLFDDALICPISVSCVALLLSASCLQSSNPLPLSVCPVRWVVESDVNRKLVGGL